MYQYNSQIQEELNIPISNPELYLLFNKYPSDQSVQDKIESSSSPSRSVKSNDDETPENFKPKSRRSSVNKVDKRAEHNAIERARRECLNSKFQQLADALPNLQNHRRPSKGQIVEKALDWVKENMSKEDKYKYEIMQLKNENKRLLNQISNIQDNSASEVITSPPPPTSNSITNTSSSESLFCPIQEQSFFTPVVYNSASPVDKADGIDIYYQHPSSTMHPTANSHIDWSEYQQQQLVNATDMGCITPQPSLTYPTKLSHSENTDDTTHSHNQNSMLLYDEMFQYNEFKINHPLNPLNPNWDKPC